MRILSSCNPLDKLSKLDKEKFRKLSKKEFLIIHNRIPRARSWLSLVKRSSHRSKLREELC